MQVILCVDDEPAQLTLLKMALNRAGYQVLEASTGQQGVELAATHRPALIIMDLMMPGMDGTTAMRYIRQNEVNQDIPILVLSAYTKGEQARTALDSGATELISKNLPLTELVKKVKSYLS